MSLTLKIQIVRINQLKAMKFAPTMSVSEACATIFEKTNEGGEDHGLFQPAGEGKRGARWLRMDRTLQYYDLKINDTLEYKKKHRPLKVKLLDDTVKTMIVDDSMSVEQLVEIIGKKMNIKNFEEFSLQTEKGEGAGDIWLNGLQSLQEQGVTEEQLVVLKKKFFVEDANISRDDPVQLHLVYVQSRDAIVSGAHPSTNKAEYLPPSAQKNKNAEKDIINEYRKLVGMSEVNAKYRYVQLCRSLKTYGITFFKTKERVKGTKKMVPKLLGITRDAILRLDFETKEVEHEYPLTHLRRWAASPASFTLDFGDYEEEYCSVVTNEGEAISQLLAGYIDILLKKRKDTGAILEENGNDVGLVESQGRMRGQAGVSITTSSVGMQDSGTGREGQFTNPGAPMARKGPGAGQGLQVTNVDTAQTAIANFINELDAQPLPVPGAVSNLSPQQWKQQLQISSKGVAAAAGKLGSLGVQPQNMDRTALNNTAKELAMTVDNMLQSARNAAASAKEDPDGEMPLLDSAKAVAEAVAKMLKVTKDLSNNPTDIKSKEAFKNANEAFAAGMSLLNGALSGQLADVAASRLIAESARAVAVASNGLLSCAKGVAEDLELDAAGQQKLLNAAQAAQNASQNCLAISQTLAPAVLDTSCKRMIIDSAKSVQSANAQLLAAYQNIGTDLEGVGLADAARAVSEAIAQLMGSTEVAEPRSGADPDFSDAAKVITENAAMLVGAQGNVPVIQHSAKAITEAMPLLIAGAKRAAQKSEDEGVKQRLLQCAKQVSDAVKGLTDLAAASANAPDDQVAFAKLQEASQRVAHLTHQLIGDSGKEAALQALRTTAKQAAAATTGLVAAARTAATSYDSEVDSAPLLAAAKLAADAIAKLIKPLQEAQKATEASPELIANLLNAAKQVAPVGYKLVAASKQAAPHITSKAKKEDLVFAANLAGEALKQLAATTAGAQGAAGDVNFDQSLEQFSAMVADLESAVMDAQSGTLEVAPGSKENTLELMNVSVQRLVGAAKNLVGAKNNPDQLGPRATELANAVQQVVNSGKAIAGINTNRAIQRSILTATKNVASQSEALVGCARALSSNPKDAGLSQAMSNAAKAVADAVTQFALAAKSADPTAKEIEDALNAVRGAEQLLNPTPVKTSGDFAVMSEKLLASTKAVAAAVDQLVKAKGNPKEAAGLARTIAVIVPELVQSTNSVAGTSPNKETAQGVINSTKVLTGELANLLQAARTAAGRNIESDPEGGNLNQAAKSVSEALRDLMGKLERTTPAQKEITLALQDVREAVRMLDDPRLATIGQPLEALSHAAKGLADSVAQIIGARDSPERMSENARKASTNLTNLVESSKYAAASASGQIKPGMAVLGKQAQDACAAVATLAVAPKQDEMTRKQIITAARQAALATSALVSAARDASAAAKPNSPEDSRAITNAAQSVAVVAGKLVNCAKEAAANNPIDKQEPVRALKELADAVSSLLALSSKAPAASDPNASNLIEAARATATATVQLMEASGRAAGGARDTPTFANMSTAAKSVTSGIQALLNAANGLKPGQKELDAAIEAIQTASVELDAAALNAAIGLLENTAPPGATLQRAQEDLVEAAKELANGVKEVVTSAKSSPEKLGAAAKATGTTVPKLANLAKQCAGLTTDNAVQQEQLSAAKALTDCLLELLTAAKNGNMNELATQAKNASQAIGAIITPIKPGVMGNKECDDAMANIREHLGDLSKPPPKATRSYHECQADMNNVSKSLVSALNTLVTAAKSKPEEVGLASKKVAAVIPALIELTRLAAAASTDAEAKQRLPDGTREIVNATLNVINDAKLVASDRKNPQLQTALGASFKNITTAVGQFVSALKASPASEKDVDKALEEVARTMAELDTAALFAAAGQLEADTSAYPTLEACQNGLLNASKAIALAINSLVDASKSGTPDQLGGHAKALAQSLAQLSKIAKATACIAGDSVSQQSLLTSARACSMAGQQLVLSARQAQKSGDPTDQTALSGSASSISQAVDALIAYAQTASAESSKGIVELDNAAAEIRKMLGAFDHAFKGNSQATPEDIVNSAKQVAEATALLVSACNNSPEDIAAAAKSTNQSTKSLLENAKGAVRLTDDAVIQNNLLEAAKSVANSAAKLVSSAKQQRADVSNPAAQQKLSAASTDVIGTIDQIVMAAGDLPGGERAKKLYAAGENLEETAEKELLAAASSIDQATQVLLAAKKKAQEKRELAGILTTGVDEAILDAARAIAQATHALVNNATSCQKEIVVAGKSTKTNNVYRRDPTWARGLISAAHAVAGAVQVLVGNASEVAQGTTEEEALVTAARGVAGATARLVAASRAKADPMSTAQQKLSGAAKTVANATSELVLAAKAVGEIEAEEAPIDLSEKTGMQSMTEKFQTEVEIMQLQKKLDAMQKHLGALNQAEYSKDKVPVTPPSKPPAAKTPARPPAAGAKTGSPAQTPPRTPTDGAVEPALRKTPAATPTRGAPDTPVRQGPPANHAPPASHAPPSQARHAPPAAHAPPASHAPPTNHPQAPPPAGAPRPLKPVAKKSAAAPPLPPPLN